MGQSSLVPGLGTGAGLVLSLMGMPEIGVPLMMAGGGSLMGGALGGRTGSQIGGALGGLGGGLYGAGDLSLGNIGNLGGIFSGTSPTTSPTQSLAGSAAGSVGAPGTGIDPATANYLAAQGLDPTMISGQTPSNLGTGLSNTAGNLASAFGLNSGAPVTPGGLSNVLSTANQLKNLSGMGQGGQQQPQQNLTPPQPRPFTPVNLSQAIPTGTGAPGPTSAGGIQSPNLGPNQQLLAMLGLGNYA